MAPPTRDRRPMQRQTTPWWAWLAGALAVVGAIGIGAYLSSTGEKLPAQLPTPAGTRAQVDATAPSTAATPNPVQHPIEAVDGGAASADAPPLPALDESDASVVEALGSMFGPAGLAALLNPQHVVQRIVATVDSLPRQKLAPDALPIRGAEGAFVVARGTDRVGIDPRNFARYAPYARIAKSIDAKTLVAWYVHAYPLFQQSYRELGTPDGYFNDRLVAVIDHLLATPDLPPAVALTQPNVVYEFADPTLESRSAGQKLLLRSGPENEAIIKAKLREIRAALTGADVPRDASAVVP